MTRRTTALLMAITAVCACTSIGQAEPMLTGPGGILDTLYGLDNLVEVQSGADDLWTNTGAFRAVARGKWAAYDQWFGYLRGQDGATFGSLFTIQNSGYINETSAWTGVIMTGDLFRFALDPSGAPRWSSAAADNYDATDHLRTFEITFGPSAGHFVLGWEDLPRGGDGDYQDLVVEVCGATPYLYDGGQGGVPEPAVTAILVAGGLGLLARRKARRPAKA